MAEPGKYLGKAIVPGWAHRGPKFVEVDAYDAGNGLGYVRALGGDDTPFGSLTLTTQWLLAHMPFDGPELVSEEVPEEPDGQP